MTRIAPGLALSACLAVALALAASGHAAHASESNAVVDRVAATANAHPDDPDLAWTLARSLARAGRGAESAASTRVYLERWPAHRPGARLEIARILLDQGASREAEPLLDEELRRTPGSGIAHFYRGLALRANQRPDDADLELRAAAVLEPALRSEVLLLRALMLFERSRELEAVSLLQELLRGDPTSDTAVRARLLLREREIARDRNRLRVNALAGFEWDENVTLEGAESEVRPSDRDDFRGVWGAGISGQPWLADRAGLLVGYRYDQTYHVDLRDYDMIQNALYASLSVQPSEALKERLALRIDAYGYDTLQDLDQALAGGSLRPGVLWSIGPRAGVVRGFGALEVAEFDGSPILDVWERDSISGGLGLEHSVPLPLPGSMVSTSFVWLRTVTDAGTGGLSDGFDGDYDADSFRVRALGSLALPFSLRAQVEAAYSRDEYLNDNFTRWLDTGDIEPRQDDLAAGRLSLSRSVLPFTRLELYWRGFWRASNVATYDYDKNLVGLLVHVSSE